MAIIQKHRSRFIDRERVAYILNEAGLDALLVTEPENVYYFSGLWPALEPMGLRSATFLVITREPSVPIAYIAHQWIYYYGLVDSGWPIGVEPILVTSAGGDGAAPPSMFKHHSDAPISDTEVNRRSHINAIEQFYESIPKAVGHFLVSTGTLTGKLGFDSLAGAEILSQIAPLATTKNATDIIKHLRIVKARDEIDLMRAASLANVEAAHRTATKLRELGTIKSVRADFFNQATSLGNAPRFMSVDGVINESYDHELQEGTSVLIDCVSHFAGYNGDYGRTIFIGEPPKKIKKAVTAISDTIEELGLHLRPGLSFSEITRLGQDILSKMGDFVVPFGPHSVGLAHTEQPFAGLDGEPVDIKLEAGMIISVDCPLMEADAGGTVHMEDLMLITDEGAEAIHDTSVRYIYV